MDGPVTQPSNVKGDIDALSFTVSAMAICCVSDMFTCFPQAHQTTPS